MPSGSRLMICRNISPALPFNRRLSLKQRQHTTVRGMTAQFTVFYLHGSLSRSLPLLAVVYLWRVLCSAAEIKIWKRNLWFNGATVTFVDTFCLPWQMCRDTLPQEKWWNEEKLWLYSVLFLFSIDLWFETDKIGKKLNKTVGFMHHTWEPGREHFSLMCVPHHLFSHGIMHVLQSEEL